MASTYDPIASQTLGADVATVTFSSIPAEWTDLILTCSMIATVGNALLQFNDDSGSNYSTTWVAGYGTNVTNGSRQPNSTSIVGPCVYHGMSSTNFTTATWQIMSYSNTNVFKTTLISGGFAPTEVNRHVGLWRSTSAISSLKLILNNPSGLFKAGCTFALYGIKEA